MLGLCSFILPLLEEDQLLNIFKYIDCLDVSPTLFGLSWKDKNLDKVLSTAPYIDHINISGMLSVTYGVPNVSLLQSDHCFFSLLEHFDDVCKVAELLKTNHIILGSPSIRRRENFSVNHQLWNSRFDLLRKKCSIHNIELLLEPVLSKYNNDYVQNFSEFLDFACRITSQSLHLDTSVLMTDYTSNKNHLGLIPWENIKHVHLANPELTVPSSNDIDTFFDILSFLPNSKSIPIVLEVQNFILGDYKRLIDVLDILGRYHR